MGKYTQLFIDESREYLRTIANSLPRESGGEAGDLKDSCRLAHSIKGMALFEEQSAVAGLAYALEKGLASVADSADFSLVGHIREGVRLLQGMIEEIAASGNVRFDPIDIVEAIAAELGE